MNLKTTLPKSREEGKVRRDVTGGTTAGQNDRFTHNIYSADAR